MKNDMSSFFEDPEFKESLAKYEGMVASHTPAYFDANELTGIADYYTSKGRHTDADQVINFALQLHPNDTDVLITRARIFAMKGKMAEARQVADLIEDDYDREVKFLRADLLMEEGRMEEADAIFTQLAEDENYAITTLIEIIQGYLDADNEDYANNWVTQLFKDPKAKQAIQESRLVRSTLCDFYCRVGIYDEAIDLLHITLEQDPYAVHQWIDLAKLQLQLYKIEEAHEALDFALAINDKEPLALGLKSYAYRQAGNLEDAIKYQLKLMEVTTEPPLQLSVLIRLYIDAQEYQLGLDSLSTLLTKYKEELDNVQQAIAYTNIAICYAGLDDREAGDQHLALARQCNANTSEVFIRFGRYYLMYEDREDEAMLAFNTAIELQGEPEPDDSDPNETVELFSTIASICYEQKHFDLAANYFELVSQNSDIAPATFFFILVCHFRTHNYEKMLEMLKRIKEEIPMMYKHLGKPSETEAYDDGFYERIRQLKKQIENDNL